MNKPFAKKNYYAITLDPVHVGTGGYRLGRVDNTIIREPNTNLPKIPGSSISGVTRAYTAIKTNKFQRKIECKKKDGTSAEKYYSCAGKGGDEGEEHCGSKVSG